MANINISDGSTYVVGVTGSANSDGDSIVITNESEVQIDADQFVKLYNSIGEIMDWPLILFDGQLKYGNKRLTYARMKGYTHIDVVDVNNEKELERVRVMTCWKRL